MYNQKREEALFTLFTILMWLWNQRNKRRKFYPAEKKHQLVENAEYIWEMKM